MKLTHYFAGAPRGAALRLMRCGRGSTNEAVN
jgi:hypothetical protein